MDYPQPGEDALTAGTVALITENGAQIQAYVARPTGNEGPFGTVVVLHHMLGLDDATKEIVRRFAHNGYIAICPDLYSRESIGVTREEAAAKVRASGGVPDERVLEDIRAACAFSADLPSANGRVGVVGYCSGGRQAFLAACQLPLDAAVDCYGPFIVSPAPRGFPLSARPLVHLVPELGCPLLGLFGEEDEYPARAETDMLANLLSREGKSFEFHTFPDAGHAFFGADRPRYRPEAAEKGWAAIFEFFGRHLMN